jgi:acyl carrier protein
MSYAKIREVFATVLEIPADQIHDSLAYQSVARWDSIGHMAIIAGLDKTFDIMIDMDDVIAINTVGKALEILAKYGVNTE